MSAPHQVLLYGRERGESFLARAREHAGREWPGKLVVQRHPHFFGWDGCEAGVAAIYVESRFAEVADAYRERGVAVFTEVEIGSAHEEDVKDDGQEAARPEDGDGHQVRQHPEGQGPLGEVTPITAARRRGRPRKVA